MESGLYHDDERHAGSRSSVDVDLAADDAFGADPGEDDERHRDQYAPIGPHGEPAIVRDRAPRPVPVAESETSLTGLPAEQLNAWLEWLQHDLRELEARLEFLIGVRARLRDQERLLCELVTCSTSRS